MKDNPTGHGLIDRIARDRRVDGNVAGHMEMDRIVPETPALTHLLEFNALEARDCKPLPNDHVAPERIARPLTIRLAFGIKLAFRAVLAWGIREILARAVSPRDDPDAA